MKFTASRIVAACLLGILAFVVSGQIKDAMPDTNEFGYLTEANMFVAALIGWLIMGRNVGGGISSAISNGLTSTAAAVFWALLLQASNEMLRLALLRRYDGPIEAVTAVFQIMSA